jgi:hypothetical protein
MVEKNLKTKNDRTKNNPIQTSLFSLNFLFLHIMIPVFEKSKCI